MDRTGRGGLVPLASGHECIATRIRTALCTDEVSFKLVLAHEFRFGVEGRGIACELFQPIARTGEAMTDLFVRPIPAAFPQLPGR